MLYSPIRKPKEIIGDTITEKSVHNHQVISATQKEKMYPWNWNLVHNSFKILCIFTTISLVIWCSYEFSKNEDVSEIIFKTDSNYGFLTTMCKKRDCDTK